MIRYLKPLFGHNTVAYKHLSLDFLSLKQDFKVSLLTYNKP